ncbi:MAG: LuxR C-terminal-related transcriptional regulator [Anaerovoracaceae bacterium]
MKNKSAEDALNYFDRPRLTELIEKSTSRYNITYLCAPFSFGKTVAVKIFVKDMVCKWHNMEHGCATDELLNEICETKEIQVFDDFDCLDIEEQNKLIDLLLREKTKCIIVSRAGIPAKLRDSQLCHIIGQYEIKFTLEELVEYGKVAYPKVSVEKMILVAQLAEEWLPAFDIGLEILTRGSARDKKELISQSYAEMWYIFDRKIMDRLTTVEREFMLAVGCFQNISIEMATIVTGLTDCDTIFEGIMAKSTYFVEKGGGVYYIHPQIMAYLCDRRNKKLSKEERMRITRSAGRYYKLRGQLTEALTCYRQAGEYDQLIPILEEIAVGQPENRKVWQLREHYLALPRELVVKSPELCFANGVIGVLSFCPKMAEEWQNLLQEMITSKKSSDEIKLRGRGLLLYLETILPTTGRSKMIISLIKKRVKATDGSGCYKPPISLTGNRPSVLGGWVDLVRYAKKYQLLRGPATIGITKAFGIESEGAVNLAIAEHYYNQNMLQESLVETVGAIAHIDQAGDIDLEFAAIYLQLKIMMTSGQKESMMPILEHLGSKLNRYNGDHLVANYRAMRTLFALYYEKTWDVKQWLIDDAPKETKEFCILDYFPYFVKLHVYLENEEYVLFLTLSKRLMSVAEAYGRVLDKIELNALMAVAYEQMEQYENALESIEKALLLGEKFDYTRTIGCFGKPIYSLLELYAKTNTKVDDDYLLRVTEIAKKMAVSFPKFLGHNQAKLEKLTDAELDVLRLMAHGMTNDEISKFLKITTNTVKFHSKNIYGKMSVKSRGQAVQVANDLKLI